MRHLWLIAMLSLAGCAAPHALPDRSLSQLSDDLAAGRTSSEALVKAYLARIAALDRAGPALHSVIVTNPEAVVQARARCRAPYHGGPRPASRCADPHQGQYRDA